MPGGTDIPVPNPHRHSVEGWILRRSGIPLRHKIHSSVACAEDRSAIGAHGAAHPRTDKSIWRLHR